LNDMAHTDDGEATRPPGHSVRVVRDSEVILFSPQREHVHVMDHMLNAMKG